MSYVLIVVDANGFDRFAQVSGPAIPDNFELQPGEVAFVVQALDLRARHAHQVPDNG